MSELEDKMVEITTMEQSKEKRMKRNEKVLETSWILNTPTFEPQNVEL